MDKTQEIIKEQLKKLPKNIRDAISSIDLGSKIRKIADRNMLHIDQAGDLETETVLVMLGLEPTADYKENIRKELNISRDRAQAITADIDKEIFTTIRESLRKISQETTEEEETIEQKPKANPAEAKLQQEGIHHPPLNASEKSKDSHLVTPLPSYLGARHPSELSESEEIKKQVAEQHAVKPVAPLPPNLPIQSDTTTESSEQKESNLGARHLSEQQKPHFENKKPTHVDPYREPIE